MLPISSSRPTPAWSLAWRKLKGPRARGMFASQDRVKLGCLGIELFRQKPYNFLPD